MNLVLHPLTQTQLDRIMSGRPHAVLISGAPGSGKLSVARYLAEQLLGLGEDGLDKYAYFRMLRSEDGKAISIESVRELEKFLSLKVPVDTDTNRVVIIEDAHLLTMEAQNALLKTLEEPPLHAALILTVSHAQSLLPTIRSRAQAISLTRPDKSSLEEYFKNQGFKSDLISKAYSISGGLPGLMAALLASDDHPLLEATQRARQLLSQSAYERLLSVDELAKNRELASGVALIMQQMAHVSLQNAQGQAAAKWQAVLSASYDAAEALTKNGNPKLALTKLMLTL